MNLDLKRFGMEKVETGLMCDSGLTSHKTFKKYYDFYDIEGEQKISRRTFYVIL